MANLYRVILPVNDIEQAAAFYASVFAASGERVSPGRHYFACGGTILACYDPQADGDDVGKGWRFHQNQYLYFAVTDLEKTQAAVGAAGGVLVQEIAVMPWGERLFYAKDPFGNPICFVEDATVFRGH